MAAYIKEPEIRQDDILKVADGDFNMHNVCIVTGAGSGLGRATAIAASVNNLMTVGLDLDTAAGKKTQAMARKMGGQMIFIKADLTRDKDMDYAVQEAAKLGHIRYLANIAGIQHIDSIENFPMAKYDQMMSIMLRAPFYLSRLVIPHFKKNDDGKGVIGNMSSVHGHICTFNKPAYNITKFGLRGLTQSIAAEGEGKIRAFTVSTGYVKTALALNQIQAQAELRHITPEDVVRDVMMGKSRVKEMMSPVEVANLFILGFSHFATYLNGGDLLFDGGMVLTY
ncbi:SDR family oxidoreductase [Patescibacteria group bacterium]|nr:SDR family oxidoreductase [Patescibacteria group bacterium]